MVKNQIREYVDTTRRLAKELDNAKVYDWLMQYGYFPESYVLPPCYAVVKRPEQKLYYPVAGRGKKLAVDRTECVKVHFPKSELTDREFGLIDPRIHNDIAYHIAENWNVIVDAILPTGSIVAPYGFPVPLHNRRPGRLGRLRAGRMIYQFLDMTEDDLASVAYQFTHIIKTDIKNFYPAIYTHSIAWALHGKSFIRRPENINDYNLLGNRLDRLFQNANDGCTNGVPIGPVVSDIVADIVAAGAEKILTRSIKAKGVECEIVRFRDDYRILVKSEEDGRGVIKMLQAALKEYNLELNEGKTTVSKLPDGLFREWASKYHAAHPGKRDKYTWKQFSELYLSVIQINRECPGTGIVDRFLADIVTKNGELRISYEHLNLQKAISMLIMLATLHVKAFPKVIAILESILKTAYGRIHRAQVVEFLDSYLKELSKDEERYKYLISWICYFLVSNDLMGMISHKPKLKDTITRSIISNRGRLFKDSTDFKLFQGCRKVGARISMLEHLDVFDPPQQR